jgi:hypothetical protein
MDSDEKRECVRAPLGVTVEFIALDEAEFGRRRARGETGSCRGCGIHGEKWTPDGGEDKAKSGVAVDPRVVDFLIHLEDKMDHMLALMAKNEPGGGEFSEGQGLNISGKGMRICCEKPVEEGRILDIRARMFRFPVVILKLFGKVLRVKKINGDGNARYEIAVEFLDLDKDAEEWIISYVFQKQREAIRSGKNLDGTRSKT